MEVCIGSLNTQITARYPGPNTGSGPNASVHTMVTIAGQHAGCPADSILRVNTTLARQSTAFLTPTDRIFKRMDLNNQGKASESTKTTCD